MLIKMPKQAQIHFLKLLTVWTCERSVSANK